MKVAAFVFGIVSLFLFCFNKKICQWQYPDYLTNWENVGDPFYALREKIYSFVFLLLSISVVVNVKSWHRLPFIALMLFCLFDFYDKMKGVTTFTASDFGLIVSIGIIIFILSIKYYINATTRPG